MEIEFTSQSVVSGRHYRVSVYVCTLHHVVRCSYSQLRDSVILAELLVSVYAGVFE